MFSLATSGLGCSETMVNYPDVGTLYVPDPSIPGASRESVWPITALRIDGVAAGNLVLKYAFGRALVGDAEFRHSEACNCFESNGWLEFTPGAASRDGGRVYLEHGSTGQLALWYFEDGDRQGPFVYRVPNDETTPVPLPSPRELLHSYPDPDGNHCELAGSESAVRLSIALGRTGLDLSASARFNATHRHGDIVVQPSAKALAYHLEATLGQPEKIVRATQDDFSGRSGLVYFERNLSSGHIDVLLDGQPASAFPTSTITWFWEYAHGGYRGRDTSDGWFGSGPVPMRGTVDYPEVGGVYVSDSLIADREAARESVGPIAALRIDAAGDDLLVKYAFGREAFANADFRYMEVCDCFESVGVLGFAPANSGRVGVVYLKRRAPGELELRYVEGRDLKGPLVYRLTYVDDHVDVGWSRAWGNEELGFGLFGPAISYPDVGGVYVSERLFADRDAHRMSIWPIAALRIDDVVARYAGYEVLVKYAFGRESFANANFRYYEDVYEISECLRSYLAFTPGDDGKPEGGNVCLRRRSPEQLELWYDEGRGLEGPFVYRRTYVDDGVDALLSRAKYNEDTGFGLFRPLRPINGEPSGRL